MKNCDSSTPRTLFRLSLASLLLVGCLFSSRLASGEDAKPKKESSPKERPAAPQSVKTNPSKRLTGAELYALHCNRCHPERYPTERTADQWKTILLHMRTRANLPAQQARTILQYLQEDSGK